jgi:hypothetical protein
MGDDSVSIVEFSIILVKLLKFGERAMRAFPHFLLCCGTEVSDVPVVHIFFVNIVRVRKVLVVKLNMPS